MIWLVALCELLFFFSGSTQGKALFGDGMTISPVFFSCLHMIWLVALCKLSYFFSHSMQGKAVITVRCRVKAMKTTSETRLLVLKTK
jgi:hypothetical protein